MLLRRIVVFAAVAFFVQAIGATTPAAADCSEPTISYEAGMVQRGETVTVTGTGFGDECYDTGPPPAGEGVLGLPITDIEIVVFQDPIEIVVARGAADADYGFEVQAPVPPDLAPGEARLFARWGDGTGRASDSTWEPPIVSDEPALVPALEVATFGPIGDERATPTLGDEQGSLPRDEAEGPPWPFVAAAIAVVAVVGLVAIGRRRFTRPTTPSRQ